MPPRDTRGVSPLVGFILLLAIVMLVLALYQVQIVPTDNKYHEIQHAQDVQANLQMAHTALHTAAVTGEHRSETLQLGMHYPVRILGINPPPVTGSLRTQAVGPGAIRFENMTATDRETADYWNTSRRTVSYRTKAVVYRPDYNIYANAPTTVVANSRVYNRHEESVRVLSDSNLVDGRDITVVTLTGNLSRARTGATTLDFRPQSPSTTNVRSITVTGTDGSRPRIRLPTRLNASTWRTLLTDELDPEGNESDQYIVAIEPVAGTDAVELVFEANTTYTLRLASVRIGAESDTSTDARYLTSTAGSEASLPVDRSRQFVVVVRDRFNNPVSGVTVNATISGVTGGSFARTGTQSATATTDGAGRARFVFDSSGVSPPANVTISTSIGSNASETVDYEVKVTSTTERSAAVQSVTAPDEVQQGDKFALMATATDVGRGGSDVIAAEWYRSASPGGSLSDPGTGNANPMQPRDGEFDAPREDVIRTVDTSGWTTGNHTLAVRPRDGTGRWGSITETTVSVVSALEGFSVSNGTAVDVNAPGAGDTDVYSAVKFNLTNEQNTSVEIDAIRVSVADGSANNLEEHVSGENEPWREEVHIAGDLQSGGNDTTQAFELGSNVTVSPGAQLSAGSTGTVYLLAFEADDSAVDMRNRTLTVTIYHDGNQTSFTVDVTKQATVTP